MGLFDAYAAVAGMRGYGIDANAANIIIDGGTVIATGVDNGISTSGTVTLNGGVTIARCTDPADGTIKAISGSLAGTLGSAAAAAGGATTNYALYTHASAGLKAEIGSKLDFKVR